MPVRSVYVRLRYPMVHTASVDSELANTCLRGKSASTKAEVLGISLFKPRRIERCFAVFI